MRLPLLGAPTDIPVPVLALPGRGLEPQACQRSVLAITQDILKVLPHRTAKTQVMELAERLLDPSAFGGLSADLLEAQRCQLGQPAVDRLKGFPQLIGCGATAAHPVGRHLPPLR